MKTSWKHVAITVGVIVFSAAANGGCLELPSKQRSSGFVQAVNRQGAIFRMVADDGGRPSIVGLWKFTFTSVGNNVAPLFIPDGAPLDAGFTEWHSDGTEIMNSSRDPATSNFCLGAWANTGPFSYKLNHFALSWDNTGQLCTPAAGASSCFVGPTNIREQVSLDPRADSYTGTVTITQYDTAGHKMFQLTGTISAHRITAD
jgi:hypothetical protein